MKNVVTALTYGCCVTGAVLVNKIIILEYIVGSTATNYVNQLAPSIFFLIICRNAKKGTNLLCKKIFGYLTLACGSWLVGVFVWNNIKKLIF